jgi:hypothetical protein
MDTLPCEVLALIVKHVCRSSVRSIGIVNRKFHGIVKKTRPEQTRLESAFYWSASEGHEELFFYYKNCSEGSVALDLDYALMAVAMEGHLVILTHLKEMGARDFDSALYQAAQSGHVEAMRLLVEWGAKVDNMCLGIATWKGNLEAMQFIFEHSEGIDIGISDAMEAAVNSGNVEAARLLKEWDAQGPV